MTFGWWVAGILMGVIVLLVLANRRLRKQLRQESAENARLSSRLAYVQRELAEVNARRRKLLAASTQALMIVEADFTVSSANKVAKRLFGKKPNREATLMTWTRQHQLQELVETTLDGEKMPPLYFTYNNRNLEAHARSIKQNQQRVAVALAVHDVTELQRLLRIRRDFVANISHELRSPLASIQLLSDTLLSGGLKNKGLASKLVDKIAAQTETLNQLAQELMDLSLIESGQAPLKLGVYSLRAIAQAQVERLTPHAARKNITIHLDIPEGITVLADETSVGRVIGNLLHNGIKFTESGSVTVSADWSSITSDDGNGDGDWITVKVTDTGIGIPAHEIDRIFERFYKVDQARNRKKAGTGLGLAIAKHVIEAHGGRIWAESSGAGSTFYFTLPVEELILEKLPPIPNSIET
jgi:two-component system phosphate regulon sensor histidine kinase PhoR